MVSTLSVIFLILGGALIIGLPIVLGKIITRRSKKLFNAFIAGILSFLVMQMIIRLPLLQVLNSQKWFSDIPFIWMIIILATSAALFETFGRIVSIKLIMKKDYRFNAGVAHGIAHGGTEAILLVGINFLVYGIIAILINNGIYDEIIGSNSEVAAGFNQIKDVLISTSSWDYLWGIFERLSTIVVQIGLSVITVFAFKTGKKIYFLLVFIIHSTVDFSSVLLLHYSGSVALTEGLILMFAIITMVIIVKINKKYKEMRLETT
jgi:uncharacterized membrane protein YhfC